MTAPDVWAPRPPQPYEPGNTASLRHGAYSPRVIAEDAEAIRAGLLEQMPHTADFPDALDLAAEMLAAAHRGFAACRHRPHARNLEASTRAARVAFQMLDELGGTPSGRVRLRAQLANAAQAEAGLADVIAAGRQAIDASGHASASQLAQERPAGSVGMAGSPEPGDGL